MKAIIGVKTLIPSDSPFIMLLQTVGRLMSAFCAIECGRFAPLDTLVESRCLSELHGQPFQ